MDAWTAAHEANRRTCSLSSSSMNDCPWTPITATQALFFRSRSTPMGCPLTEV